MQTVRCPACKGAKEVMSLGMRVLKCKTCSGIGHVAAAIKDAASDDEQKELVPVVKRRRKKIEKIDIEETEKEVSAMQGFCESLDGTQKG